MLYGKVEAAPAAFLKPFHHFHCSEFDAELVAWEAGLCHLKGYGTDAVFMVNYDLGKIPKMYILLFGSKSIEPRIKAVFSNFDYEIVKMDQDKAILRVKNVSRLEKGFYLHDYRKLGASINTIIVYTPDSPRTREYSNLNSTPNTFYRS